MIDLKNPVVHAEVEQLLSELLELEANVKPMIRRINEIKEWCKEQGSFCTLQYVCSVQGRMQKRLIGLQAAIDAMGGEEALEELGLIQIIEFLTVHVGRKSSYNGSDLGL